MIPRNLFDRPGGCINVGSSQPDRQQVAAAEDVERQVAIAVVMAVEEPPLLMPMQRIIRGIEIEDNRHNDRIDRYCTIPSVACPLTATQGQR